jgi:hypothetical protein
MTPRDILAVADELLAGATEAFWCAAVSRAYSAAFHAARQVLQQGGFVVPRGDQAHSYLWLRLANSGHADVALAGGRLGDLRRMRNWADYDLDQPFTHRRAVEQFHAASDILRVLEALLATPAVLAQVTGSVRAYERDVLGQVTWQP